jgi:5-enolpyruvylshikimate-3-phosphate synthase
MALAVAALAADGSTHLEEAACAAVSFPAFYDELRRGVDGP